MNIEIFSPHQTRFLDELASILKQELSANISFIFQPIAEGNACSLRHGSSFRLEALIECLAPIEFSATERDTSLAEDAAFLYFKEVDLTKLNISVYSDTEASLENVKQQVLTLGGQLFDFDRTLVASNQLEVGDTRSFVSQALAFLLRRKWGDLALVPGRRHDRVWDNYMALSVFDPAAKHISPKKRMKIFVYSDDIYLSEPLAACFQKAGYDAEAGEQPTNEILIMPLCLVSHWFSNELFAPKETAELEKILRDFAIEQGVDLNDYPLLVLKENRDMGLVVNVYFQEALISKLRRPYSEERG